MSSGPVQARFVNGLISRHIIVMTLTSAIGLMAMFAVDLADLYFLGLLQDTQVTAAIGYAGTIAFANLSLSIGTGIAAAALVARNLGAGKRERAKEFASSSLIFTMILSSLITLVIDIFASPVLMLLGAHGQALDLAYSFLITLSPGFVLLAAAVSCSFSLRGLGDAKRAMYITLSAALVTAVLDPLFILGFSWGIQGAAVANVIADLVSILIGLHGLSRVHKFLVWRSPAGLREDFPDFWSIAFPSMLTQLATPFATAFVTRAVAPFGNEAVAASAIIGRVVPVAFGIIFSLSGAIGPIIGQNFGARQYDRVKQALSKGLLFSSIYTLAVSVLLYVFRNQIADGFNASGQTVHLVVFFCTYVAVSWVFAGAQFVANAAFNNLGYPSLSTWFNWGKATLGTIPFAYIGAAYSGAEGVMVGTGIGSVIFGVASVIIAFRITNKISVKR